MAVTQLFAATHEGALARSAALDADRATDQAHTLELAGLTAPDLEVLGEIAARAVQFGAGDLEPAEVDLEHEQLFQLPAFLREVLVELGASEDAELVGEVAAEWSASEEMDLDGPLTDLVGQVVELVTEAEADGTEVYLWVADL